MRKWVLRLHLYLGLLCSSYLIIFGVSSLNFNHPFEFTKPRTTTVNWERSLALPPVGDDTAESEAVRDALGLIGWTIPWETRRESSGDLHFGLARPGKHYTIHVLRSAGIVRVDEQRKGHWTVIRDIHGNKGVPRSNLMTVWGWYTELCTFVVLFAAGSGVYLFATRKKDRRAAWAVLGAATALSLGFMLYVRYGGEAPMYDTIRRIHLYTGVALLAFVVMYFVTGYVLIHHDLVSDEQPPKSTREEPLAAAPGASPEQYSAMLQRQFGLAGKRQPPVRMSDGSWKFTYFRPGAGYEAVVAPSGDKVRITTSPSSTRQTLVHFHRMHGYGGGWLYDLWCVVYDLASASMILFALSGIYLWYKLTRRRLLGWLLLAVSFSFATGTILYLVYAP